MLIRVVFSAIAFVVAFAAMAQEPANTDVLVQLGPDPFVVPPHSLGHLVNRVPAAVIAEIIGPGELEIESIPTATGLSRRGYASYRVVIREVLFNRLDAQAPPLVPDLEFEFIQLVGRGMAEAFVARRVPVAARDECLLFLWYEPPVRTWEILHWAAQFRRARGVDGRAHGVAPMGDMRWVGPTVGARREGKDVDFEWNALVAEVRRMSRAPGQRR